MSVKNSSSAQKRNRQGEKRRIRNKMYSTKIKSSAKKIFSHIEEKNKDKAAGEYKNFSAQLQKAARRGLIQKNTAARKQSRMQKKINALQ